MESGISPIPSFILSQSPSVDTYSEMYIENHSNNWFKPPARFQITKSSEDAFTMACHLSYMTHTKVFMHYLIDCLYCSSGTLCFYKSNSVGYSQKVTRPGSFFFKESAAIFRKKSLLALLSSEPQQSPTLDYPVYLSGEKESKIFDFHCLKCGVECKPDCSVINPPASDIVLLNDPKIYNLNEVSSPLFFSKLNPNQDFIFIDLLGSWKGSSLGGILLKKFLSICSFRYPGIPILLHPLNDDINLINYYNKFGFKRINWPFDYKLPFQTPKSATSSNPISFEGVLPTSCLFFSFSTWTSLQARSETNGLMFFLDS